MSSAARRLMTEEVEVELLTRLTPRDIAICGDIHEHRVLTSVHLRQLHFTNERTARRRLNALSELSVLRRFRPYRKPGSAPWHYFLGQVGARVLAAHLGLDPREFNHRRDRLLAMAGSRKLAHLIGVNNFFCSLVAECRRRPGHGLEDWWGEGRCLGRWGGYIAPDGFGVLGTPSGTVGFFLEYDRATEDRARVWEKLDGYAAVAALGEPRLVLFCVPSEDRERALRKGLPATVVTVATTTEDRHAANPLGRNWWVVGNTGRLGLADLTDLKESQ